MPTISSIFVAYPRVYAGIPVPFSEADLARVGDLWVPTEGYELCDTIGAAEVLYTQEIAEYRSELDAFPSDAKVKAERIEVSVTCVGHLGSVGESLQFTLSNGRLTAGNFGLDENGNLTKTALLIIGEDECGDGAVGVALYNAYNAAGWKLPLDPANPGHAAKFVALSKIDLVEGNPVRRGAGRIVRPVLP